MKSNREGIIEIGLIISLGTAFLALSYLRILGDTGSVAFHQKLFLLDAILTNPIEESAIGHNLIVFGAAQFVLHINFVVSCWVLARLSKYAWPTVALPTRTWLLLWFAVCAGWTLVANAAFFPSSSLGEPYAKAVTTTWHGISIFSAYTTLAMVAIGLVALCTLRRFGCIRYSGSLSHRKWLIPATGAVALIAFLGLQTSVVSSQSPQDKPNVILIGFDSLRYDAVRKKPATNTPAIDNFLEGATVNFTNATTPLARTFPSWVSIITGKHPHTTGAVMNLMPRDMVHTEETLPSILRVAGYKTTYAIDEVRFSNLDLTYGFEEMIAPAMGATDFFINFFSDTPLSNLVVNSWLGELMFPYTHANRAAAKTYYPTSFVTRLERNIQFDQPLFAAIHLTLAHWPYTWADSALQEKDSVEEIQIIYDNAVARLDLQFANLMSMLKNRGALDNAIVVLLSDHGESLGVSNHELRSAPEHDEAKLYGHGTSVFSNHQYHVLLAFRSYGETTLNAFSQRETNVPVTLEDITPTLLDLLSIPNKYSFDGISLTTLLSSESRRTDFENRIRFAETEFNPPGIGPGEIISKSALFNAAKYYRIDPKSDRVTVKSHRLNKALIHREYAAFKKGKLLVAAPGYKQYFLAIDDGAPIPVSNSAIYEDSDVLELWKALQTRFPDLAELGMPSVTYELSQPR